MAKKCLNFWGANLQGARVFQVKVCADSGFYRSIPGHPQKGANLIAVNDGVETIVNGAGFIYWAPPHATRGIEEVAIAECPGCIGDDSEAYDIINGSCVQAKINQTPGKYSSLDACTADLTSSNCQYPNICVPPDYSPPGMVCLPSSEFVDNFCKSPNICVPPNYCPPGMVCLPSSEFSEISGLASSLENEICS
jgi:hypothetical protein